MRDLDQHPSTLIPGNKEYTENVSYEGIVLLQTLRTKKKKQLQLNKPWATFHVTFVPYQILVLLA